MIVSDRALLKMVKEVDKRAVEWDKSVPVPTPDYSIGTPDSRRMGCCVCRYDVDFVGKKDVKRHTKAKAEFEKLFALKSRRSPNLTCAFNRAL